MSYFNAVVEENVLSTPRLLTGQRG